MKVFYHTGNKNPFVFEANTNESTTIIYHLSESRDRVKQSIGFAESMLKCGEKKYKSFLAQKKRELRDIEKILNDYETFRKEFTEQA